MCFQHFITSYGLNASLFVPLRLLGHDPSNYFAVIFVKVDQFPLNLFFLSPSTLLKRHGYHVMAPRRTTDSSIKHISRNEVYLVDSIVLYFSAIQSLNLSCQCTVVWIVFLQTNSSNDLDSFNQFAGTKFSPEIRPPV